MLILCIFENMDSLDCIELQLNERCFISVSSKSISHCQFFAYFQH